MPTPTSSPEVTLADAITRILITGKTNQVGYELERSLQGLGEIIALNRCQKNLADLDQVHDVIRRIKPMLIINPAACTAVDKAESEPQLAFRINAEAPGMMAEETKKLGSILIHYSTDTFSMARKWTIHRTIRPVRSMCMAAASSPMNKRSRQQELPI